jgi:hypothetical protein
MSTVKQTWQTGKQRKVSIRGMENGRGRKENKDLSVSTGVRQNGGFRQGERLRLRCSKDSHVIKSDIKLR